METALITLICVAIIIVGTVTTVMTSIQSATSLSESLKEMEDQAADIRRTEIDAIDNIDDVGDDDIDVTVVNEGHTDLAQFPRWDVIAQYQNGGAEYSTYLEYTTDVDPGDNQWTVDGIYMPDDTPEVMDPNILNPGEKVVLRIDLNPLMDIKTYSMVTVSTPNGVTSQSLLYRK
jgi:archaellum component FlaG (FlaF/FlaG flagellin family)